MSKIYLIIIIITQSMIFTQPNPSNHSLLPDSITIKDLCTGVKIADYSIHFFIRNIKDTLQNTVDPYSILREHNPILFITCSPYVCGECERIGTNIVNNLSHEFPDKIKLLMANWFYKDTEKALSNITLDNEIDIYLDPEGENIARLNAINFNIFNDIWYVIVDSSNTIQYLFGISYYFDYTDEVIGKVINDIKGIMSETN